MTADLENRLRAYRPALDAAIDRRVAEGVSYIDAAGGEGGSGDPSRRRWIVGAALATAVATVVAMIAVFGPAAERTSKVTPASAPEQARVLLDAPGWHLARVDERDGGGEQTFVNGTAQADLTWSQGGAPDLARLIGDRVQKADGGQGATTAAGQPAEVMILKRDASANEYRALWQAGGAVYEFRTLAPSSAAFDDLAGKLHLVDAGTWRAALPPSAVAPDQRSDQVDRMLTGVPLPPGFDPNQLRTSDQTKDRYQLGAEVAGAVACGWIGEWAAARAAGDTGRAAAAASALGTSRNWAVLAEMNPDGDYPEVLWEYADAINGDGTVVGGKQATVQETYRDALGCRGTIPSHG